MRDRDAIRGVLVGHRVEVETNWVQHDLVRGFLVDATSEGLVLDVAVVDAESQHLPCPGRWLVTWPDVLDVKEAA